MTASKPSPKPGTGMPRSLLHLLVGKAILITAIVAAVVIYASH